MSTSRKNYYSENYILLGRPYEQQESIQCIVDEYKDKHSDFLKVNGIHLYLNYVIQNPLKNNLLN